MDTTKKTILIVEDERPLGEALKHILEKEGYHVLLAENGEEGLKIALEHKPHVIACDIAMPKMDGPTFIKKLHNDPWGEHSYTFALTNYSDSSHVTEMLSLGITTYFVKADISPQKIVQHINSYIEKHPEL